MLRKTTLLAILILIAILCHAQNPADDNYGWRKRISFIVGAGASIVLTELYDDPVINKTNNFVTIEKASYVKTSLSMGIVYTPFVSTITRTVPVKNSGKIINEDILEYYPRGFSMALFINPVSFGNSSGSSQGQRI